MESDAGLYLCSRPSERRISAFIIYSLRSLISFSVSIGSAATEIIGEKFYTISDHNIQNKHYNNL